MTTPAALFATIARQPTQKEIEDLKGNWSFDPCWDIEDTEGFEAVREELLAYRKQMEARWEAERHNELLEFAAVLGLGNSLKDLKLAEYIQSLENRIAALEAR